MMYNGDCEVYIIRYFNVWFYLFAKTETGNYKIENARRTYKCW